MRKENVSKQKKGKERRPRVDRGIERGKREKKSRQVLSYRRSHTNKDGKAENHKYLSSRGKIEMEKGKKESSLKTH